MRSHAVEAPEGRSLGHRLAVILLVGGVVLLCIFWAVRTHERLLERTRQAVDAVIERAVTFRSLYETLPRPERIALLRSYNRRLFRLWIERTPPEPQPPALQLRWPARHLADEVAERLEPLGAGARLQLLRPVPPGPESGSSSRFGSGFAAARDDGPSWRERLAQHAPMAPDDDDPARDARPVRGLRQARELRRFPHVLLSVPLENGRWLNVLAAAPELQWQLRLSLMSWGSIGLLLVVVSMFALVRRATRPLTEFAAAAERLGRDVDAPPLPVRGPREVRHAARTFNTMQTRLRQLLADRTEMLAGVSHDLRTMLTRFRLRIEEIGDDEQRARAERDLEEMQAMLDASLAYAREESNPERFADVDMTALLQSLVDDEQDLGHSASLQAPPRLVARVLPVAIRRALTNLITNAIRYGGRAEVTLTASATAIEVRVEDRGPGIPEDQREAVFRPFYRLEQSRSRETGGSGLGLAVCRTIIHRHGGTIELETRSGGGLSVRVRLPRHR